MKLTFIDVETPNCHNNRVSSVGVVCTDMDGKELYSQHYLVNPEQKFDALNIELTGISRSDVADAPTFDRVWFKGLADAFDDCIVIAHNASFDLNVLNKCFLAYGIKRPEVDYICTYQLAKQLNIRTANYRLPTLCDHFKIVLPAHHHALHDAYACKDIFFNMLNAFLDEVSSERFEWKDDVQYECKPKSTDGAMADLYGIALGIGMDGKLFPQERGALEAWMRRNSANEKAPFFRDAYALLCGVLADGVVTKEERQQILFLTEPFLNLCETRESVAVQALMGVLRGVAADGILNPEEVFAVNEWIKEYSDIENSVFAQINKMLEEVLDDGVVTEDESNQLLESFRSITDPIEECGCETVITGKRFVLSGDFVHGTKDSIAARIASCGGEVSGSVSKKIDYVVVGGEGSDNYSFGSYGTKVKKAMELREKGVPIAVIAEDQLFELLEK